MQPPVPPVRGFSFAARHRHDACPSPRRDRGKEDPISATSPSNVARRKTPLQSLFFEEVMADSESAHLSSSEVYK